MIRPALALGLALALAACVQPGGASTASGPLTGDAAQCVALGYAAGTMQHDWCVGALSRRVSPADYR